MRFPVCIYFFEGVKRPSAVCLLRFCLQRMTDCSSPRCDVACIACSIVLELVVVLLVESMPDTEDQMSVQLVPAGLVHGAKCLAWS